MASDMQSRNITERLHQILEEHGDCVTPCLISMLLYGVEYLDEGLEPCCEYCVEYGEIARESDSWCSDITILVECLA